MLFFFLVALPFLLLFSLQMHKQKFKKTHPPGPLGLPLVGNLHQMHNSSTHIYLFQLAQKYGPLVSIQLGSRPTLVVSSANIAKEFLKTHDRACSVRPFSLGRHKLSYNGLDLAFSPYNDYWRVIRKICTLNLFNSKTVQSFRLIREDEVSRMVKKISLLASSSKVANLSELLISLASTVTCRIAFGERYDDDGYERSRFHGILIETQALMAMFFVSDYFPTMGGWIDKVSGLFGRLEKNFKEMDLFYQSVIDAHLDPNRPQSKQQDIIDILLQLRNDPLTSVHLTLDHIKAMLLDLLIAGTDPSAATVIWVMTALMKNPRAMKKVQQETREILGNKSVVNEDDIQILSYLKCVIKETMRLYPPAPLLLRETIEKCTVNGYEVPRKTLVFVNSWAIGRDPEAWVDPEEFLPERFLHSDVDFRGHNFELIPFGAGRRGCPGINMGVAIVELALANLLYLFDWEIPEGMRREDLDTDGLPGLATHKKNDLCLVPKN
ncbi:6,7,8-trihydroxycoumarin synthase-like [Actinidia eriantha]|uniref:6,7,8-trihydroxycoumarin synthase-like n=1 Tax=Actinidia eriantha TaxID=165200 RepID=UPI0025884FC2|nr:6,7,8-trihydroxycoumarin synthase-like [Actinidia eriantha]